MNPDHKLTHLTWILITCLGSLLACEPGADDSGFTAPVCESYSSPEDVLIPMPQELEVRDGCFELTARTRIIADETANDIAERFASNIRRATGFPLEVVDRSPRRGDVVFRLVDDVELGTEGYALDVMSEQVSIEATSQAGLFYGWQTLRQMFLHAIESDAPVVGVAWSAAAVEIRDWPRFEWRGAMLDIARRYFGPVDLRQLVDWMSAHKMNRLHLHLTDDQGGADRDQVVARARLDGWCDAGRR